MTSPGLTSEAVDSSAMSSGSLVKTIAPQARATVTTVASTMSRVPALPHRTPAVFASSRPTGTISQPCRNRPSWT